MFLYLLFHFSFAELIPKLNLCIAADIKLQFIVFQQLQFQGMTFQYIA